MESFYYLLINLGCIALPFAFSFDSKVNFASTWKAFLPACFITLTGFVIWDVAFTDLGIWGFNPEYLIGIDLLNLPIDGCSFSVFLMRAHLLMLQSKYTVQKIHFNLLGKQLLMCFCLSVFSLR